MGDLIRSFDWSATPIGPLAAWSPALRMMVRFLLANRFPLLLWWGPQYISIYNDAYRPVLGKKHPWALGRPVSECWSEIWHVLQPLIDTPYNGGPATWNEDIGLEINRHGFVEETHFTIAYSPVPDESVPTGIGGVLATVHEITEKTVGERRLVVLRDLGDRIGEAKTAEQACALAAETLSSHPKDVPFVFFYLTDDTGRHARLAGSTGVERTPEVAPAIIDLDDEGERGWPVARAMRTETVQVVTPLKERFASVPPGPWSDPPHTAVVMPIPSGRAGQAVGAIVAGLSARLAFDQYYRDFLGLVRTQVATAISHAVAYEEERKRAEALAQIDRAKTAFFSNVSHEFRTPLTLLVGPIEDALGDRETALSAVHRERLTVAHRNALRLLRLVNTLLDFSRLEAGRVDASYEPTDLATLTAEFASVFRAAVEKAGLALIVDCPPLNEPTYVDREMWEKIVLNLLSNAFKFTFEGHIRVELRPDGDHVQLRVADTGVGIPQSDLPRMFERFYRVKNARARTDEGTGIGLALVHELARLHGGGVAVTSREGAGTTFTVTIRRGSAHLPAGRISAPRRLPSTGIGTVPYVEEALRWLPEADKPWHPPTPPADVSVSAAIESDAAPRILIADDNADMREYLGRILGQHYRVEVVADGHAALTRIRASAPDLVLTDVMMPNLDGFGLLAAIRGDERTRSLPVVLLSARAGEEARIEGLQAGADEYLVKPFSARELLASVASQLQLARLRRESERALRYRSQQYETLLNQAPLGVFLVDADFKIRDVNPVALPMFGDMAGGIIGRDFDHVIHGLWRRDSADEIVRIFRRTLETGEAYVTAERAELRIDRDIVEWYEWRVDRITLPDGRFGLVCYVREITAAKRAEAERLRLLQENAAVTETLNNVGALVASDLDRTKVVHAVIEAGTELTAAECGAFFYKVANEAGQPYTLYASSEAARETFSRFSTQHTEFFEAAFKGTSVLRSGDIVNDSRYRRAAPNDAASARDHHVRGMLAVPVKGRRGEVVGNLFFGHSEAHRFDEHHERLAAGIATWASVALENARLYASVQDASRVKDDFLASLSHELRTPLNAILGYARMLRANMIAPGKTQKAIETIERNATSLNQIVEDVLDISRIVSGKIRLNVQTVDFPEIVRNAVDAVAPGAEAKGVRIDASIDPQALISGDPDRLQQILWNLLSNAVKFTNHGGTVDVRLQRADRHVELTVSDTGIGIPAEFLPYVFERFRQADSGIARERGGLGLGLAIARQLTEMHGGTVAASSAGVGKGATFSVRFPLAIVEAASDDRAANPRSTTNAIAPPATDLSGIHVLAVDDEQDALTLLSEVLEAAGARVSTAHSADDALTTLNAQVPDVLVADLGMPQVDGFVFIDRVRRHANHRVRGLPAAALTAYARSEDRTKALRAGFQIHLAKPIDPAELVTSIAALARRITTPPPDDSAHSSMN